MKKLDYVEHRIKTNIIIRHYNANIKSFPWRRNIEDTTIEPLSENDWLLQIDNQLPIPINKQIYIPKEVYYREIPGATELNIKIKIS